MHLSLTRRAALSIAFMALGLAADPPLRAADAVPIRLEVDAREASRKIFHAKLWIPAVPGPLTLLYPKWLPGEHGPTGPIADVAGIHIRGGGKEIAWTRDPVEMWAIRCSVPPGATEVEVSLDYLSAATMSGFSSGGSATTALTVISWNQLLLYPQGTPADVLQYSASLRLPAGWSHATALSPAGAGTDPIRFAPVSLTTLVDSPVLAGSHLRTISLSSDAPAHRLNIAADSAAALEIRSQDLESYRRLVRETAALFGARHYSHYDFLLTLSDFVTHFGLEHHESSDDRVPERSLIDEDKWRTNLSGLLPHEMVHSWNGKYRRPAGLMPGHFDEPMRGELLWVYEGLTEYLGEILTARTGMLDPDEYRESLAETAAEMQTTRGRSWRPLADTAVDAQILYAARPDWAWWRRGTDFYAESSLLWLEADTLIRARSGGKKSLDDFCRLFYGKSGPPTVLPYTADDVFAALNQILPYDWKSFWTERLTRTVPDAPLEGIVASGWKMTWSETISTMSKSREEAGKVTDVRFSIGIEVSEDGTIPDVVPDSPAARAGAGPGMRLVAVNGRRWSREALHEAVRASKTTPVELLLENGDAFATYRLEYTGGERFPILMRDASRPDLLTAIIQPLVPPASGAAK